MQHPHHLAALTTAWTLHAARHQLAQLLADRRHLDAQLADTRDGLRSSVLGSCGGSGFGDPVARTALLGTGDRDELADLARSTADTLHWLAGRLIGPHAGPPLTALTAAIPGLHPSAARELTRWLGEADRKIRDTIGWPEQLTAWPGDCPSCGVRMLQLHDAAPDRAQWTVTCDCTCAGEGCPCQMPVRAAGVTHIWLRTTLVAPVAVPSAA